MTFANSSPESPLRIAAATFSARAFTGEELSAEAKISLAEARAIALKGFPGTVKSQELERKDGGSGLRYSFDIKSGSVVHVDATSRRILKNSVEPPGR